MLRQGLLVFYLALLGASEAAIRGVHPANVRHYQDSGGDFTCIDGSDSIPFSLINDDYCDCKYVGQFKYLLRDLYWGSSFIGHILLGKL